MATGFLILTLYGICIFLVVALIATAGGLYLWGRREEAEQDITASEDDIAPPVSD